MTETQCENTIRLKKKTMIQIKIFTSLNFLDILCPPPQSQKNVNTFRLPLNRKAKQDWQPMSVVCDWAGEQMLKETFLH